MNRFVPLGNTRGVCRCLAIAMGMLLVAPATEAMGEEVPYGVPAQPWPEEYGKHRARIQVQAKADAVWVHIPWRRRDADAAKKRIIIVDAATGQQIKNVVRADVNREFGDLVFQPVTAPGEYHVYYLPYRLQPQWGGYGGDYLPPQATAEPTWVERNGLSDEKLPAGKWKALPKVKVLEIQARAQFSRFDPMEVVATKAETRALRARYRDRAYLVFPEDRTRPIRMFDDLPLCWIKRGPSAEFCGKACRNEFYVYQIGLYASRESLDDVAVTFHDLRRRGGEGGDVIPASAMRCFNLGGTNWDGKPLHKTISVSKGAIGALWCGVQVPQRIQPGEYLGKLTVEAKNVPPTNVDVTLEVSPDVLADCGDADLWRHSRLRWLDSTIAIDDEVVAPYTPLKVDGTDVQCLNRDVCFDGTCLPTRIRSGDREILAAPIALVIETNQGASTVAADSPSLTKQTPGAVVFESRGRCGPVAARCRARMEFDGHITIDATFKADQTTTVKDIRLEIPFRRDVATYMMGMGRRGGYRPKEWQWKWGGRIYYDSFWIGDVPAGLQCELRGADYCGPMVNLYWSLRQLKPPTSWHNSGKGGLTVREAGDRVIARAYSGERTLEAGKEIRFEFALLVTPVKPLDTASHFKARYYHDYQPIDKVAAAGANVINIHHANELNPYINYPFLANAKLAAYVKAAHEKNIKVKLYYTLRELTNHVVEMWALRSLGHEVLAPGGGGGYPWLREHLASDYAPSWYQPQPDGEACAAIVNSGLSRWYNYYLEGLAWLLKNVQIDGLYNDDVSYDRQIMKRVRKILDRTRPGSMIDLHSNTAFSKGPANQYMEFFPYVDRLWFGEGFNYDDPPDYWLVEISGIPYGLMGDMLQNGGNRWRGMIYGMTSRFPWADDAPKMWKLWDRFGIAQATMRGYWDPGCPVRTDRDDVLATAYVRKGTALVAVASWCPTPVACRLRLDYKALGLDPSKAQLYAPAVQGFQEETRFASTEPIPVLPARGWVFLLDNEQHEAPPYTEIASRPYQKRELIFEDTFTGDRLAAPWTVALSKESGTRLMVKDGSITIQAKAHRCGFAERPLPAGSTLVECRVETDTDQGMTWGAGLGLAWPDRFLRLNLRPTEGRVGVDDGKRQWLLPAGVAPNKTHYLRIRLEAEHVVAEMSFDRTMWFVVHTLPRSEFPGDPVRVRVGKMAPDGGNADADATPNPDGTCRMGGLRVYRNKR